MKIQHVLVACSALALHAVALADVQQFAVGAGAVESIDAAVDAPDGVVFTNTAARPPCVTLTDVYPLNSGFPPHGAGRVETGAGAR